MKPYYDDGNGIQIFHGDCREILPTLGKVDLVLTDPPYSSGGFTRNDRNVDPGAKYRLTPIIKEDPSFAGDNRDQRSFMLWCSFWTADCLRVVRNGAALLTFIDWRQLPCLIDAVQVGGWVYRGLIVWDKTESQRPQKGWFRSQCEYIVCSSAGPLDRDHETDGVCQPGLFRCQVIGAEKQHLTEKPVHLLQSIISTRADWQLILDPFMGSGTTLVAAKSLGRRAIGVEIEERYAEIAARRLAQEYLQLHYDQKTTDRRNQTENLFGQQGPTQNGAGAETAQRNAQATVSRGKA